MSAIQARKWKQSIKYDGKPIGEWLATNEEVLASQKGSESSTNPDNSGLLEPPNEHDNSGRRETSMLQPNCISSVNGTTDKGNVSRESLEFTLTQSGTTTLVNSGIEEGLQSIVQNMIAQALTNLEKSFRDEIKQLANSIVTLSLRVSQLEEKLSSHVVCVMIKRLEVLRQRSLQALRHSTHLVKTQTYPLKTLVSSS